MDFSISNQVQRKGPAELVLLTHYLFPLVFFGPFTKPIQKEFRPNSANVINAAVDFSNTATTGATKSTGTANSRTARNLVYDFNTLKWL